MSLKEHLLPSRMNPVSKKAGVVDDVCVVFETWRTRGIFFSENPLKSPTPRLLLQLSLSAFLNGMLQYLLTPLGQSTFVPQILAGVILGPSCLGSSYTFAHHVFPYESFYISDTFSYFGVMLFLFIVGIKMDLSIVRESGRKAFVIGTSTFLLPLLLSFFMVEVLERSVLMESKIHKSIHWVASFQSMSSSHVILCLLYDLKLLNSDLGRLAVSSSMIGGGLGLLWTAVVFAVKQSAQHNPHGMLLLMCLFIFTFLIFMTIVLRPILLWMERNTIDEKSVKESYVFVIFIMILGSAMFGEIIGQHFLFGPMILGAVVPDGPPLGSALIKKLDCVVSYILLPIYFVVSGSRLDFSLIMERNFWVVVLMAFSTFLWKLVGAMLPSIYYKMSVDDALCLGLILSVQGINDCLVLERALQMQLIDKEVYTIMVFAIVLIAGTVSPIIKILYKPEKRYTPYRRRTIQHSQTNAEFHMLACLFHQDQTPSIVNLLEASNPNPQSPICFYVVHLIDLAGRAAPLLVDHHKQRKSFRSYESEPIINALRLYQYQNQSRVMIYPFTAISPYATMHDEVCTLAMEKRVSIAIVPFHKLWNIQWSEEESKSMRAVNRTILKKAPCSVGILVDRGGNASGKATLLANASGNLYSIGVLFLGGQDDREAVAFGTRMAKHPNVGVTLLRLIEAKCSEYSSRMKQDVEVINHFRQSIFNDKYCVYQEEMVKDSIGLISIIRKFETRVDLVIVGRRHDANSTLLTGLTDWNEFPELGFVGDVLASPESNSKVSVLVVQQQSLPGEDTLDSPNFVRGNSAAVMNVSWTNSRVWPTQ